MRSFTLPRMRARIALLLLCACSTPEPVTPPSTEAPAPAPTPQRARAEPAHQRTMCLGDGFCIERPRPIDGHFRAAVAFSREDVWAVAEGGAILRFDGTRWRPQSVAREDLFAVSGTSASDLYVSGRRGLLRRFDGSSWSDVPGFPGEPHDYLPALLAVGPSELIAGTLGAAYLRRGDEWSLLGTHSPPGTQVFSERGHVAVFGSRAVHRRRADGTYVEELLPTHANGAIRSLFVLDDVHAFATGEYGDALNRDESGWHSERVVERSTPLSSLWGVVASSPEEAWAVSGDGQVHRFDGRAWSPERVPWEGSESAALQLIERLDDGRLIAAGEHLALRDRDGTWTSTPFEAQAFIHVLVKSGPNEAWALGSSGTIAHFDGVEWQIQSGGTQRVWLEAVSAASASRAHAVGQSGAWLRRTDQGSWERVEGASGRLKDVLVRDADVLAVGELGAMYRWTEGAAARIETSTDEDLLAIAMTNEGVFVAGVRRLYALEGGRLVPHVEMPGELEIASMAALPSGELIVGTQDGGIVRVSGERAHVERRERFWPHDGPPRDPTLRAFTSAPDGVLYATASEGATPRGIARRAGGRWTYDRVSGAVHALAIVDGAVWAFGERAWRREGDEWIEVPSGIHGPIQDACVTPDGTLFVAGTNVLARRSPH